jgi:hypothetical protein
MAVQKHYAWIYRALATLLLLLLPLLVAFKL